MKKKPGVSRRTMLKTTAQAAALAPFMPFWLRDALSQTTQRPEAFITIHLGHGAYHPDDLMIRRPDSMMTRVPLGYTTGGEVPDHYAWHAPLSNLMLPPGLNAPGDPRSGPIGGTPGVPRLSYALEPLNASLLAETLVVAGGGDLPSAFGHHNASLGTLSVVGGGRFGYPAASFDYMAATLPGLYTNRTFIQKLVVSGGGGSQTFAHPIPNADHNPIGRTPDHYSVRQLFEGLYSTPPGRLSLIDKLQADIVRLRSSSSVGSADRQKLDLLRDGFQDIRTRFLGLTAVGQTAGCTTNFANSGLTDSNFIYGNLVPSASYGQFQAHWAQMARIIPAAIQCGASRVFSISETNSGIYEDTGGSDVYHQQVVHRMSTLPDAPYSAGSPREIHASNLRRLFSDMVVPLATELQTRGLLSRTIILVTFESGFPAHTALNIPHIIIGGSALGMRGGNYVDLRNMANPTNLNWDSGAVAPFIEYPGVPKNWLFATLGQALGLNPGDDPNPDKTGFVSKPPAFNYRMSNPAFLSHATNMRDVARVLTGLLIR